MKTQFFRKIFYSMAFAPALFFSVNCGNFTGGDGIQPQSRQTPSLIVAGSTSVGLYNQACYWINGEQVSLHNPAWMYSYATDLSVSGNNIYVCGEYSEDGTNNFSCYWVNNVSDVVTLPIPGTATSSVARRIIADGSDVYVLGTYYDVSTFYCYWINGVRTDISTLAPAIQMDNVVDMFLYDGELYIAGRSTAFLVSYFTVGGIQYWPGGGALMGDAMSIFVDGAGVHMVYYYLSYSYLLNDTVDATAAFGTSDMTTYTANDLYISGSDIYVSGYYYGGTPYQACYWQNGTLTDLGNGTDASYAYAIQYFEGHVYTAGTQNVGTVVSPCYWIDGSDAQFLAAGQDGEATAIWDPYMDKDFDLAKCMKNIYKK